MDLFIDTEFAGNRLLEVAIVKEDGDVLFHSLVRPDNLDFDVQWKITQKIHGIGPDSVKDAPSMPAIQRKVLELCAGHRVIGYAVSADTRHFPLLKEVSDVLCLMKAYKTRTGITQSVKLSAALAQCGIAWSFGKAHGALADAQAARALWFWLQGQMRTVALEQFDRRIDQIARRPPARAEAPAAQEASLAEKARMMAERFAPHAKQKTATPIKAPSFDPAYPNKGKPWSTEDSERVRVLWGDGVSIASMSAQFGRTEGGIVARIVHLGLAPDSDVVRQQDAQRHPMPVAA
jgi:DNA polymerase III epsilon subunit-like protein